MKNEDAENYRRREQDERQLADRASSETIRNRHLDFADHFREMAQEVELNLTGQDVDDDAQCDGPAALP